MHAREHLIWKRKRNQGSQGSYESDSDHSDIEVMCVDVRRYEYSTPYIRVNFPCHVRAPETLRYRPEELRAPPPFLGHPHALSCQIVLYQVVMTASVTSVGSPRGFFGAPNRTIGVVRVEFLGRCTSYVGHRHHEY